jgi:hypothetical protein
MTLSILALAVHLAHEPLPWAKTFALVAGGGKTQPAKNAACMLKKRNKKFH